MTTNQPISNNAELTPYGKVMSWGSKTIEPFVRSDTKIVIQEKIDGSHFSFGSINGELWMRSKNIDIFFNAANGGVKIATKNRVEVYSADNIPGDYAASIATAVRLHDEGLLPDKWIFRCEAMRGPKHVSLAYDRAPTGNLVLFDIDRSGGADDYLPVEALKEWADRLGVECVITLYEGARLTNTQIRAFLNTESALGGPKIEGLVIKPVDVPFNDPRAYDREGRRMIGKLLRKDFEEVDHNKRKNSTRPTNDIVGRICDSLATEARWRKAVQRLREEGDLHGTPKDIGPLIRSIQVDVHEEEADNIAAALYDHHRQTLFREVTRQEKEKIGHKLYDYHRRKVLLKTMIWDITREAVADQIGAALYNYHRKKFLSAACKGFPQWYKRELAGMN